MKEEQVRILINSCIVVVIATFSMVMIPLLTGLGAGGFENADVLQKWFFYGSLGLLWIGMGALLIIEVFIKDGDENYGSSVLIHSPSEPPSLLSLIAPKASRKISAIHFILLFLIIFSFAGIYANRQHAFYTGVPTQQQFTEIANLSASTEPASTAETIGALFIMAIGLCILRSYARKVQMSKGAFILLAILLITFLCLVYGLVMHQARYGSVDKNIIAVVIFWSLMGFITAITGSIVPALVLHFTNNFYLAISQIYGGDKVIIFAVSIIAVSFICYMFLLYFMIKKKPEPNVEVRI